MGLRKYHGPCPAHPQHTPRCNHCEAIAQRLRTSLGISVKAVERRSWARVPEAHSVPIYPELHWVPPGRISA